MIKKKEEIKHDDLMSKKYNKVLNVLNYLEYFFVFVSVVSGYILSSTVTSLVGTPIIITSPVVGLKVCVITPEIKIM